MIRGYDTNALWRHDEILRIRHLEAEIAARQEEIDRLRIPANSATDSEVNSATDSRACRPGVGAKRRDAGTAHISLQP